MGLIYSCVCVCVWGGGGYPDVCSLFVTTIDRRSPVHVAIKVCISADIATYTLVAFSLIVGKISSVMVTRAGVLVLIIYTEFHCQCNFIFALIF